MSNDRTKVITKTSAIEIGTELNQTYKIDKLLGVGGMGEVFKGHNIQTGDPVAIKVVLPEYARDEMIFELFRKEARVLNHLNHDAIVRYYVFSLDRVIGRPYLAMEYVDGPSLATQIKDTPLAPGSFFGLLRRLSDGLHRAHEAGVIHRDISPDNVILPGGLVEKAKIIDFGIARSASVGGGTLLGGGFAGKYNYVSPEQLGLFGGEVTPKSDIYSLGLMMAAALRGRPLDMSGSQVEVIEKRRTVPQLSGVGIPKQFHAVLTAMLQPDPADRPESMAAVRDWDEGGGARTARFSKKTKTQPGFSGQPGSLQKSSQTSPNAMRNMAVAAGVLAAIGLGAYGGWTYFQGQKAQDSKPASEQIASATPPPAEIKPRNATVPEPPPMKDTERLPEHADVPAKQPDQPVRATTEQKPEIKTPPLQEAAAAKQPELPPAEAKPQAATPPVQPEVKPVEKAAPAEETASAKPPESATGEAKPQASVPQPQAKPDVVAAAPTQETAVPKPPETQPKQPNPPVAVNEKKPESPKNQTQPRTADTQVAMLPQPPKTEQPQAGVDLAALRNYVQKFGEDSCFRASVEDLSATSAQLSVLSNPETLSQFKKAFLEKAGFMPQIKFDELAIPQCSFIGSINKVRPKGTTQLAIKLNKTELRGNNADTGVAGDPLKITVTGVADRNVYLFVVDHDGGIQNINRACPSCLSMKDGEMSAGLSLFSPQGVDPATAPPFYPMLIFVAAAAKPLNGINGQDAFDASDFDTPLQKDAASADDFSMQVAYLKLKAQ